MDSVSPGRTCARREVLLLEAEVVWHASARLTPDEIATERRRREALAEGGTPLAPGTLRNADDQTVAAVAVLRAAVARAGAAADFEGWGVLAAPRFLGRSSLVVALDRFRAEGVWGVSPHLIPQFALHAQAGALSLALGGHGPNLGIGGGRFAAAEGIVAALSWLASGIAPGVWLILTGWSPEYLPDPRGKPTTETGCEAVALALAPVSIATARRLRLRVVEPESPRPPSPPSPETIGARLEELAAGLEAGPGASAHSNHAAPGPPGDRTPLEVERRVELGTDASGRLTFESALPRISSACGAMP